jgi:flagellar L-ring protein precursor FlgH
MRRDEIMKKRRSRTRFAASVSLAMALLLSVGVSGKTKDKSKDKSKPASTSMEDYLARARSAPAAEPTTPGSLWVASGALADTTRDYKAHAAGDLIMVRLNDSFAANTSGENATSRAFATNSAVTGFLGQLGPNNSLQNLFNGSSTTTLDGKGASTLSSSLQLVLGGRVLEVMPNGMMLIEAVRDFTVGNDRQTVVLRGLVRPGDVAVDNSILSTLVTSMELEIKGKGSVADASARPNILVRTLLKILAF